MPRKNSTSAGASVGTTVRAITRPFSSRTDATVVAWWTSNATYLVVRFMRAAPCWGPRVLVDSMVAARGALSTCVRQRPPPRLGNDDTVLGALLQRLPLYSYPSRPTP